MSEKITMSDFDIVGIIKLKDIIGIEKYVTPLFDNSSDKPTEFLSRSKEYYNVKTLTELSDEREKLKQVLTRERTKKNFVILENMMNCSAKVYYRKLEEYVNNPNSVSNHYVELSKACLLEDTKNMITLLEGKGLISVNSNLILPGGYENCVKRIIEMDNKAMLYVFGKNFKLEEDKDKIQIATPGYGSIYIGPFLKCMYGYDFTNILKSKYINEMTGKSNNNSLDKCISNREVFNKDKKVVLIDDNIGTGTTMQEIKQQLLKNGIKCYKSGAIQYNWRNYFRVISGEKADIDKFNIDEFEIITPFNYAGHKLYSHAIDILHECGNEYINYLNSKSYRVDICNDLMGSIKRGVLAAKSSGVTITSKDNKGDNIESGKEHRCLKQHQIEWIDSLIKYCENICVEEKYQGRIL